MAAQNKAGGKTRAAYLREWRRKNPEKVREYRRRAFEKAVERRVRQLIEGESRSGSGA